MEPMRVVGFVGSRELFRYSIQPRADNDRDVFISEMKKRHPELNSEVARIYINGMPVSRYDMGQTIFIGED